MKAFDPSAVPLKGVQLLQASAGTGKTHSLADLHLRLLLEGEGLDVSKILVVTYTNAAASELRERLRARIARAQSALAGVAGDSDRVLAARLRTDDPRDLAAKLDAALADYDRAPVGTIHSFCQRVLRERVFECDALANAEVTPPSPDLEDRIARSFLRRSGPTASGPAVELTMQGLDAATMQKVVRLASGAEAFRVSPDPAAPVPPATGEEEAFASAVAVLTRVWPKERAAAQQILSDSTVMSQSKYRVSKMPALFDVVEAWLKGPDPAAGVGEALAKLSASKVREGGKGGRRPADSPLFAAAESAADARDALMAVADRMRAAWLARLAGEAPGLRRDLHARMNLRSYDELVGLVRDALTGPGGARLAAALARDYPVAMVDEFQDTDPSQYAILRALHDPGGAALFLIGDPKQSIYAFRGADIFSYGEALKGARKHTLNENWRSTPRLVQAVNAVFARDRAFVLTFIDAPAVRAAKRDDVETLRIGDTEPAPMTLWLAGRGADGKALNIGEAADRFCAAIASETIRLLDPRSGARIAGAGSRPLAAGDLAVLVSTHAQGARVRAALERAGVPTVVSSPASVFGSSDAAHLRIVLNALVQPRDMGLLRGAAMTPVLGWTAAGLAATEGDPAPWDAFVDRWQRHHERWGRRGFGVMFQRLLAEEGTTGRLLSRADGERRVTNLRHLADLLGEAETSRRMSPAGLVAWFDAQISGAGDEAADEAEIRLESDASRVRIVTIHRSKGLQYPVVFCPFLWALPRGGRGGVPVVCHEGGDGGTRVLDTGGPDVDAHTARRATEGFQESVRLAYVALTRARIACYVGWGSIRDAAVSPLAWLLHARPGAAPGEPVTHVKEWSDADVQADLARLVTAAGGGVSITPPPAYSASRLAPAAADTSTPDVRAFHGDLDDGWRIASFSSLKASTEAAAERPDHDETAPPPAPAAAAEAADERFRFPAGPGPGRLLHTLMECVDFREADERAAAEEAERLMPQYGIDVRWREAFARAVCATLDTPLDASGLRLRDLDPRRCLRELPFLHPVARITPAAFNRVLGRGPGAVSDPAGPSRLVFDPMHGFLKGYIDLVFEAGGKVYILDYKSNLLGPSPDDYLPERLAREMAAADYDLQVALYCVAVRRLLLSRGWTAEDFDRRFGGAFYLFMRGLTPSDGPSRGVHFTRPAPARVAELSALFDGDSR